MRNRWNLMLKPDKPSFNLKYIRKNRMTPFGL